MAIVRQIDCFDVAVAGIAGFNPNVRKLGCGVDGEFLHIFFTACRGQKSSERPLSGTQRADQRAFAAVPFWPQDSTTRLAEHNGQTAKAPLPGTRSRLSARDSAYGCRKIHANTASGVSGAMSVAFCQAESSPSRHRASPSALKRRAASTKGWVNGRNRVVIYKAADFETEPKPSSPMQASL